MAYRLPNFAVKDQHSAMKRLLKEQATEENFSFDCFKITASRGHILPSDCHHGINSECSTCLFNAKLNLPHLPEMVFPYSSLVICFSHNRNASISFNALDALKKVDIEKFPDVQVKASAVWQEARSIQGHVLSSTPFDWTYTSEYQGTITSLEELPTDCSIDNEILKRRDPILFYSDLTLYEDELADHGCARMHVRIRIMKSCLFVLARFYLRVDGVLLRILDTRLFGESGKHYLLKEWTKREANFEDLSSSARRCANESNQVWEHLPIIATKVTKLSMPKMHS